MRLATFLPPGSSEPLAGVVSDERAIPFEGDVSVLGVLSEPGAAEGALAERDWPLSEVTLLAPIPRPRAIFAIGMNYADHVAETGAELPQRPVVFLKLPSSAAAPGAPVRCPPVVRRLDYEGELTVVMGPQGTVAGYTIADDVSARDLQKREPHWVRGKAADGFCPYGPWITTAEDVPDPHALALRTWVNGELRQDSSTSQLIFKIPELIEFIGETCTLQAGDLILTGTPSGVGMGLDPPRFLSSGDVVRIEIERLGWIEHPIA